MFIAFLSSFLVGCLFYRSATPAVSVRYSGIICNDGEGPQLHIVLETAVLKVEIMGEDRDLYVIIGCLTSLYELDNTNSWQICQVEFLNSAMVELLHRNCCISS